MSTKKARREAHKRWLRKQKDILAEAIACTRLCSNNKIRDAATKPTGCSDVRWRIELRRRRNEAYYDQFGTQV